MKAAKTTILALLAALALTALLAPSGAAAASSPAWRLEASAQPTNFPPGLKGTQFGGPLYLLVATNVGAEPNAGPMTVTDTLPSGLVPVAVSTNSTNGGSCAIASPTVTCSYPGPLVPGDSLQVVISVEVTAPAGEVLQNEATVSGGAPPRSTVTATTVSATPPPFSLLPGFGAPLSGPGGEAATQAGSHPYLLSLNFGFPTERGGSALGGAGHVRDIATDLPAGAITNPAATPVRCTEVELLSETSPGCPAGSQIGTISTLTVPVGGPEVEVDPLYNMVPPPGHPAEFAAEPLGVGLFIHILGEVRSDGDYGLSGYSEGTFAVNLHPVFGARLELWGKPSDDSHEYIRACGGHITGSCQEEEESEASFLTLPGSCSGSPLRTVARVNSWEEPNVFHTSTYESADIEGNPVSVTGCEQLSFKPTLSARPTTNLADSPSGLDVDLHQPVDERFKHESPAVLKDATVTLPAGMVANPSQAAGLESCSEAQIGYLSEDQEAGIHFSKQPNACPEAAKLGTLEVTTPLLAEYAEIGTKLETDPETGEAIPRPLHGSVYLAEPFQNPFGSLLALYLAVEDPASGTVAKLAGRVIPDPATGQLTTVFEDNPQLPLEDVRLHLFGGARGALITPPICGDHVTTSTLTPWSSPKTADAHPEDSFQISAVPGGGNCPASAAAAANAPSLSAGTLTPQAGAYSPLVLKVSREDGSQRIAAIETTLPPGLTGKLAGIAECSPAQIAQAEARSHPEQGLLERQAPSCPLASDVGIVNVGAGAGPTPYYTQGHAYLAGPYKGAPLSLAVIVPAIAGPFDLGTVVNRVALQVDPVTAQIHAVSDPLPQILDGIPLDVRSVALRMDRPDFTLNPTSCDPMKIAATATSAFGQAAPLSSPFQVGGCRGLAFKPSLKLSFKGGVTRAKHPALRSVLTYPKRGSNANIASAAVTLPNAEIIDQDHVGNPCTRPQFAEEQCPKISILGRAKAWTPLLDEPLEGNVYFRANGGERELPDIVADLKGKIEVTLIGAVKTVTPKTNPRIRTTFFAVPDAPVSRFELQLKGGKDGLLVNSANICRAPRKAVVAFTGQNGKAYDAEPVIAAKCPKGKRGKAGHRGRRGERK